MDSSTWNACIQILVMSDLSTTTASEIGSVSASSCSSKCYGYLYTVLDVYTVVLEVVR